MKVLNAARDWIRSLPLPTKIGVFAGLLVLGVTILAVVIPVSPNGRNIFGAPSIVIGNSSSATGSNGAPSTNPTRGPSASSNGGAGRNSGDMANGHEPCDEQNRAVDDATKKQCVAGYVAPTVALDSITCAPGKSAGEFVIRVVWKLVGGKYKEFRMSSADRSGPLEEEWTITHATAETVLFDQHSVSLRFLSMSTQPGIIDRVHSEVVSLTRAGDVCDFGEIQPTNIPTDGATDTTGSDG